MRMFALAGLTGLIALGGCATTAHQDGVADHVAASQYARSAAQFERDRQAILAMAGEFDVTFDFRETVALAEGYELKEPKLSGAHEVVRVIEDEGDFIALQHFLLVGDEDDPFVIKHWRQDWRYEPARIMSFRGHDEWEMVEISDADSAGAWSQSVYQVDDSPRYAGLARWSHEDGLSSWEPELSWRPLPRRDDTTRSDYDAISAVNRHVITPDGWVHEQDNTKLIVPADGSSPRALVREVGVNTYIRSDLPRDDAADDYWAATQGFWGLVRERYHAMEAGTHGFVVADDAEGTLLYSPVLNAAQRIHEGEADTETAWREARALLDAQITER